MTARALARPRPVRADASHTPVEAEAILQSASRRVSAAKSQLFLSVFDVTYTPFQSDASYGGTARGSAEAGCPAIDRTSQPSDLETHRVSSDTSEVRKGRGSVACQDARKVQCAQRDARVAHERTFRWFPLSS
jgi:hypothetical protein